VAQQASTSVSDQDAGAGRRGYDSLPDRHRFDGMTVDQIARCHQQNMFRIYDQIESRSQRGLETALSKATIEEKIVSALTYADVTSFWN